MRSAKLLFPSYEHSSNMHLAHLFYQIFLKLQGNVYKILQNYDW